MYGDSRRAERRGDVARGPGGDHVPQVESPILCVETEFFLEEPVESLHGFFLLVPDQKAFDAIFRAVRVE